ncbi:bacterial transcriptional activator domain-containing protein [Nocardioides sp. GY 10127]|uniref:AfsR/SARP family transcriptional regulator n=1 Tax=Nocardioides sp. GY 10127 TaxID=2569762 RepID=UPI001458D6D5|nr:bacterial transcriptional activator domain-containing protein [Nocardioides sp. GY 10127]
MSASRIRPDAVAIRDWLGTNPRTGDLHLPKQTPTNRADGYRVTDLLVDADLFRRLRARGQARGESGMEDLTQALRLVAGKPFDSLRANGWNWLLVDELTYEALPCAIVDTAHLVVLDALRRGDAEQARTAAETACKASPYDEVSRLDLAKALAAGGHTDAAAKLLSEDVFNGRDDAQAPIDLPKRTKDVTAKNGWGRRGGATRGRTPTRPQAS